MKETYWKAVYTLTLLLVGSFSLLAQNQFPSQVWHQGIIYGKDGQTYSGLVKYDLEKNWVQLQTETIATFTASNVSHFEIQNPSTGGLRSFYSLPYREKGENQTPVFFEVLTEGNDFALLCREYIATYYKNTGTKGVIGMNPSHGPQTQTSYRLEFDYYFFKNQEIQPYHLKKKDLLAYLPGHETEINLFMRENKLEPDKRRDLMRITAYYNELNNNELNHKNSCQNHLFSSLMTMGLLPKESAF